MQFEILTANEYMTTTTFKAKLQSKLDELISIGFIIHDIVIAARVKDIIAIIKYEETKKMIDMSHDLLDESYEG